MAKYVIRQDKGYAQPCYFRRHSINEKARIYTRRLSQAHKFSTKTEAFDIRGEFGIVVRLDQAEAEHKDYIRAKSAPAPGQEE